MSALAKERPAPAAPMAKISEKQFQQMVVDLARYCGWKVYHTHLSKHSAAGFPDLCLARKRRYGTGMGKLIFVELKSERGRVRPEQMEWLIALGSCEGVTTFLWRPSDWPTVVEVLK